METQTNSALETLKLAFPSVPQAKIAHCLKRFNGDVTKVQEKLKSKFEKTEKVAAKYNLKTEDIKSLCEQFSELRLGEIIKGVEASNGDLSKAQTVLGERQAKGKHHGHRRHNRSPEELGIDISSLVEEYKKLYPEIPEDKIKRVAERSCSKLKHFGKKLGRKGKKCSSSKSSKECERSRSRSRKHKRNKCQVEKPANFDQLLIQLKTEFPTLEERKLCKILQRNEFNVEKATQRIQHRLAHKKHREGNEDELLLKEIPSDVSRVIVDGNNLLFVNEIVRGITIRSGMARGTQALSKLISAYNSVENRNILVVYDETHAKLNFENIKIEIARPKYESSDDYLVAYCELLKPEERNTTMFVTSDIGLKDRLFKAGGKNIMKSGKFVKICESKIPNLGEILQK